MQLEIIVEMTSLHLLYHWTACTAGPVLPQLTTMVFYTVYSLPIIKKTYSAMVRFFLLRKAYTTKTGWMDGWLGFNGILSKQVAAISCLKKLRTENSNAEMSKSYQIISIIQYCNHKCNT